MSAIGVMCLAFHMFFPIFLQFRLRAVLRFALAKTLIASEASLIRLEHVWMRNRRMQVNWHVQRLSTFEDYPVLLVVEKFAANVTIDHGALETELRNGSFQLFRCRSGLGRRQCS